MSKLLQTRTTLVLCRAGTCTDARTSVGKREQRKVEGNGNVYKKNLYQLCLFLFSNDVDLKNNTEIIENHSEDSGFASSCNKFTFIKGRLFPRCPP